MPIEDHEKRVSAIRALTERYAEAADAIRVEANYFEKNADRMHYRAFRRRVLAAA